MIKALSNLLTKNIGWKVISLITAFSLWFICMNISNPRSTEPIPAALEILGENNVLNNGYIILNKAELDARRITVRVGGNVQKLSALKRDPASAIKTSIDLGNVDISQTNRIGVPMPVSVKCDMLLVNGMNEYTMVSYSPMSVDVILDTLGSETMQVTVERLRSPSEGYVAMDAIVSPARVKVTGAQTLLDTIESIGVSVNLENVTGSVNIEGEKLTVYDNKGIDITEQVGLSVDAVKISVPVMKYARIPINAPTFTGNPAVGYNLALPVKWEPQFVEVVGDEESISALTAINLDTIDLTGRSETEALTFDLVNYIDGTNLSIRNGTPSTVTVNVVIEREDEKEIEIPLTSLRYTGMTSSFELPPGSITLRVRGSEEMISGLAVEDIRGSIDLTDLEPGTHSLPVNFNLPEGVVQVQPEINISVEILDEVESEGSMESPAAEPSLGAGEATPGVSSGAEAVTPESSPEAATPEPSPEAEALPSDDAGAVNQEESEE